MSMSLTSKFSISLDKFIIYCLDIELGTERLQTIRIDNMIFMNSSLPVIINVQSSVCLPRRPYILWTSMSLRLHDVTGE